MFSVEQLIFLIIAVLVVMGIWRARRHRWSLEVVADQKGVRSCRGIPKSHEAAIVDFLEKDVPLKGRVRIRGQRQKDGLLRLHVDGAVDSGSRQRIRNFLLALL